ncbi:MAG: ABC transporter permease subunit [Spirochaetes bacterium]|nr:ABC transporter permease subunit [Spirochaetota bacterium]
MGFHSAMSYIVERLPELWLRTGEHCMLAGCSTLLAILVGVPAGIMIFRKGWLRSPVMGSIGILQTIPSLAMLVFLLALLDMIGVVPALIALTVYALLPIVRNTLTGLDGVAPEIIEAARGIGMTAYQELRLVRMPLAMPVIVAGIRTAAVVGVGIATLSAFIGAGGLGQFINRGLALYDTGLILLGAVPAAVLALIIDFSIGFAAWAMRPEMMKSRTRSARRAARVTAFALPVVLLLAAMYPLFAKIAPLPRAVPTVESGAGTIRIGTKNFTEQLILGEIMARLIEARTDLIVKRVFNMGGTMMCHGALVGQEIDLYAEYTGTALTAILKEPSSNDPKEVYRTVARAYGERFRLKWLKPFGFNNTYVIAVRESDAEANGWRKVSDLREAAPRLRAGFTAEFAERPDGYPGFREKYQFRFGRIVDMDPSLMYGAIAKSEVDAICAFTTDGRITSYRLKTLDDDMMFFPPYYAAPVVRKNTLLRYPEIADALSLLAGLLDDTAMQRLNYEVDGKKRSPEDVANDFLMSNGLL